MNNGLQDCSRRMFRTELPVPRSRVKAVSIDAGVTDQVTAYVWSFGRHRGQADVGVILRRLKGPWAREASELGLKPGDRLISINGDDVSLLPEADIKQTWREAQLNSHTMHLEFEEEFSA